MAWCRVSSLTAAVTRTLEGSRFPMSRNKILAATAGRNVEGWELNFFLSKALRKQKYENIRSVLTDLSGWLDVQG